MAWTLINEGMDMAVQLQPAELIAFNTWGQSVDSGTHPKTAAENVADMNYEVLNGTPKDMLINRKSTPVKCCSIRLSKATRVYFVQVDSLERVKVLRIGDHTLPSWPKSI